MTQRSPLAGPRTKIVATIGPASAAGAQIDALLDAGISVARINCAHGDDQTLRAMIEAVRERAERRDRPLAILADLGGPKLRLGRFEQGAVELLPGRSFRLTTEAVLGSAEKAFVDHPGLPAEVRPGDAVFLNDGLIRLVVTRVGGTEIDTEVDVGGWLSDRKGLSVPSAAISAPALTEKDWRDLDCVLAAGVDYVGLSFVRSEADIAQLRDGLAARGRPLPVVAKIEKAQAVARLEAIVGAADAVMVARGDLGVECPIEEVPVLQKRIIRVCNESGTPVITATQMLESMVGSPRPTRAEASDVANAVLDGTDAVMLSAETASGKYPVEAVTVMRRIIVNSEASRPAAGPRHAEPGALDPGAAIGHAACLAAESVDAEAIVCLTQTGVTARHLARWRPRQPLLAVTPDRETWRRLSLVWGVEPVLVEDFGADFDAACTTIAARLHRQGRLSSGRKVVVTAGLPFSKRGRTNTLRIETV